MAKLNVQFMHHKEIWKKENMKQSHYIKYSLYLVLTKQHLIDK